MSSLKDEDDVDDDNASNADTDSDSNADDGMDIDGKEDESGFEDDDVDDSVDDDEDILINDLSTSIHNGDDDSSGALGEEGEAEGRVENDYDDEDVAGDEENREELVDEGGLEDLAGIIGEGSGSDADAEAMEGDHLAIQSVDVDGSRDTGSGVDSIEGLDAGGCDGSERGAANANVSRVEDMEGEDADGMERTIEGGADMDDEHNEGVPTGPTEETGEEDTNTDDATDEDEEGEVVDESGEGVADPNGAAEEEMEGDGAGEKEGSIEGGADASDATYEDMEVDRTGGTEESDKGGANVDDATDNNQEGEAADVRGKPVADSNVAKDKDMELEGSGGTEGTGNEGANVIDTRGEIVDAEQMRLAVRAMDCDSSVGIDTAHVVPGDVGLEGSVVDDAVRDDSNLLTNVSLEVEVAPRDQRVLTDSASPEPAKMAIVLAPTSIADPVAGPVNANDLWNVADEDVERVEHVRVNEGGADENGEHGEGTGGDADASADSDNGT